jgi:hypothetical protein
VRPTFPQRSDAVRATFAPRDETRGVSSTALRRTSATGGREPVVGSTVWAVVHPIGPPPTDGTSDERVVSVMGEVNGVLLDAPGWGYAQVWSTRELCLEHAWSMQCLGRRCYEGLEVRQVRVVGPTSFRLTSS